MTTYLRCRKWAAALACVLALAGCANVSGDFKLEGSEQGLLVGSMTTDLGIGHYSLLIVSEQTGQAVHPAPRFGSSMVPAIPPMHDGDLKQDGAMFAVALAPGRYRFIGWSLKKGYHASDSKEPFTIPFAIEAGEATYLGNVHWRKNWRVVLSDQSARDLSILSKRYPTLSRVPLGMSIEPGSEVIGLGGNASTTLKMPIFIPIPVRR